MPTKTSPKKKAAASKKSSVKSAAAARGPLPPYGVAIREAVARGDVREMQKVATAARKHLKDVQTALAKLDAATGKKR